MLDLNELNEAQREAVKCCDAPTLVIAGAGSGKTRVLTYKIAYLLEQGMQPWNILALTFTNKAAREMRERIGRQVGEEVASRLWMGTFHSIFSRILRSECQYIGFQADFTIYDAADSKNLIKTIIKEMGLDEKTYKPASVAGRISNAKNALILPGAYQANAENKRNDAMARMPEIGEIYTRYCLRLRQSNAMDFDDLLLFTWILFSENADVARKYEDRFEFVLVDEYQDTNFAQHQIVWLLTKTRQRVCVVGDDAQSIYSFRGANIDNILHFQELYRQSRLFKLEENYRSTQTIVTAANSLISHNQRQIRKQVYSRRDIGSPVTLLQTYSDIDEANAVVRIIRDFHRNGQIPYNQMVILYRTNAQSRTFEESMRKSAIPYRIYGGLSFYQRKEIKDVIAYLRLTLNPRDEEALKRIVNYPTRGIGNTTLDKVFMLANQMQKSPWEILCQPSLLNISTGIKNKISAFTGMIKGFNERSKDTDAYSLALEIVRMSSIQADINHGSEPDDISRQENLQELVDGIASFVEERREQGMDTLLENYLQEVSLLTDLDQSAGADEDRVTMMTVHSAKGLEFRVVFVVGLEENLFPSDMSSDFRGVEEERRLFYVAMTRAKEHLILTNAKSRFRFGKTEFSDPSRFLREIDPRLIRLSSSRSQSQQMSVVKPARTDAAQDTFAPRRLTRVTESLNQSYNRCNSASPSSAGGTETCKVTVGNIIVHERFGRGVVRNVEGTGMDTKATVEFENAGTKQLLLRFAKFKLQE